MEKHNRVRAGKFKNINTPYALVRGVVFPSISAAESYCTREGLDANECVKSEDAAVLAECKRIAGATLPVLREIKQSIQCAKDRARDDLDKKAAARDAAAARHELGWRAYEDHVRQALGVIEGLYESTMLVNQYIYVLEKVLWLKAE